MNDFRNQSLRVLVIIPGEESGSSFIFAKRQVESIKAKGIDIRSFYFSSRTNPLLIIREVSRFRKMIKVFQPQVIHAQYGTVTALIPALFSSVPLVITLQGSDINYTPADGFVRDLFGRLFTQFSCLKAKKIICVSRKLKEKLWSKWNDTNEKKCFDRICNHWFDGFTFIFCFTESLKQNR